MRVVHFDEVAVKGPYAHRPGGIAIRVMLTGEDFAPDNYGLWIVDTVDEYFTPRHRHNFDQVRVMVEGSFAWGKDQVQEEGTISYFPEGTYYTQGGRGRSRTLLLQVAGASGQGYMSLDQLEHGIDALKSKGSFKDGVFTWIDDKGGKHNMDGHEAVWEHVMGQQVRYPKPRFDQPVFMRPENVPVLPIAGAEGAGLRRYGVFNERGLELSEFLLDAGAEVRLGSPERAWIAVALDGEGTVAGQPWRRYTAMRADRGEAVNIQAVSRARLFLFGLPVFEGVARIAA